jgi:hypothetical protein
MYPFYYASTKNPPGALVIKQLFLAREQKNSGKKFFLFIEHEVLFYETPFLHRARRIYVCGATALARPHLEEVSSSDGLSLEFLFETIERPITCVSALYDARQAS